MKWTLNTTADGQPYHQEGEMDDPFQQLNLTDSTARISCTVQRGANDYGASKCSFTVTINCPQEKAALDYAATLLYDTALRYANWGIHYLAGVPPLPGPLSDASTRNT
jgi:hypothetical protein